MADNFAAVSSTVKANDRNISDALANLADVTRQLKVAGLDKTAQKASGALDSITLSLNTLRQTLNTSTSAIGKVDSLAERLLRGEGTVGKGTYGGRLVQQHCEYYPAFAPVAAGPVGCTPSVTPMYA
jgi:ABC-type transporter Mla subunit MlaD